MKANGFKLLCIGNNFLKLAKEGRAEKCSCDPNSGPNYICLFFQFQQICKETKLENLNPFFLSPHLTFFSFRWLKRKKVNYLGMCKKNHSFLLGFQTD